MSCESCSDEAKERYRELDQLRVNARQRATEEKRAMAICKEEGSGQFIVDAESAIANRYWILEIISGL